MNAVVILYNSDTHESKEFPCFAQLQAVMRDICIDHVYAKPDIELELFMAKYEMTLTKKLYRFIRTDIDKKYKAYEGKCKFYFAFLDACEEALKTPHRYRIIYKHTYLSI